MPYLTNYSDWLCLTDNQPEATSPESLLAERALDRAQLQYANKCLVMYKRVKTYEPEIWPWIELLQTSNLPDPAHTTLLLAKKPNKTRRLAIFALLALLNLKLTREATLKWLH